MSPRIAYLVATSSWFMGFGMQSVVFAWLVTIVLREPAELVGWAQTALLLPGTILILLAGAVADRVGPDRQAIVAQSIAVFVPWLLIAALALGYLSYGVMLAYAVVMGCAQAFVTPARDGLLNHVADERVQRLVMLTSLFQFTFQMVGVTVAGFADTIGGEFVLGAQSLCMMIGVIAYVVIKRSGVVARREGKHASGMFDSVREGARTVMASPTMRIVVVQNVATALFFMGCFIVCFPLVIREVFAGSSADIAILNAFNSAGLVLTILIMLRVGYVRRAGRALLMFHGLGGIVLMCAGLMDEFPIFVLLIFFWGLCGGIAIPMSRTLMQELAPPEQRARVMSVYAVSFMGAGPLGTLFCGYLSELLGPQMAIVVCGASMLGVMVIVSLTSKLWTSELPGAEVVQEATA